MPQEEWHEIDYQNPPEEMICFPPDCELKIHREVAGDHHVHHHGLHEYVGKAAPLGSGAGFHAGLSCYPGVGAGTPLDWRWSGVEAWREDC